jgi:hypothetical protein
VGCGEEKNLDPTENRTPTPRSSSPSPVAIPTTLSRLLYLLLILLNMYVTNLFKTSTPSHILNYTLYLCLLTSDINKTL